jgi:hypothetical protein
MKFRLAEPMEVANAYAYLAKLAEKGNICEIKKFSPGRTLAQNRYLHLILGAHALNYGNKLEDSKDLYKWVNRDIYYKRKTINDEQFVSVRSSADLDTAEMTKTIDLFREYSKQHGFPLPAATDQGWLMSIENDMEMNSKYLRGEQGV